MKTKHWPRSRYVGTHRHSHHAWTWQTHKSTLAPWWHSHETWHMRHKLAFWRHTTKQNEKGKKKDHSEAKRWTVDSELFRGHSKHLGMLLRRCVLPGITGPLLPHLSAIPPHPPSIPKCTSATFLLDWSLWAALFHLEDTMGFAKRSVARGTDVRIHRLDICTSATECVPVKTHVWVGIEKGKW